MMGAFFFDRYSIKRPSSVTKKDNCDHDSKKRAYVVTKKLIMTMIRKIEHPRSQKKIIVTMI